MDRILSQTDYDAAVAADVDAGAVLLWYETVWARCEAVVDTRRRAGIDGALEEAKADAYDDAYADCYQGYYELITDQPDYDPDGAEDLAHEDADQWAHQDGLRAQATIDARNRIARDQEWHDASIAAAQAADAASFAYDVAQDVLRAETEYLAALVAHLDQQATQKP